MHMQSDDLARFSNIVLVVFSARLHTCAPALNQTASPNCTLEYLANSSGVTCATQSTCWHLFDTRCGADPYDTMPCY